MRTNWREMRTMYRKSAQGKSTVAETSELEQFTNRILLITHSNLDYREQRQKIAALLEAFRARINLAKIDEENDSFNEETFKKIRLAEGL